MNEVKEILVKAFPRFLLNDVLTLWKKAELKNEFHSLGGFTVFINGELLEIPYRIYEVPYGIYLAEPDKYQLTVNESLILNCLFTRHHDGFVRQKSLKHILSNDEFWITPFIAQLLGEYVIEILITIEKNLSDRLLYNLARFITENPKFFEITKQRVISYWDCYYRHQFPTKEKYVGFRILNAVEEIRLTANNKGL